MNRRKFLVSTIGSSVLAAATKNLTYASEKGPAPSNIRLSSLPPRLANQGWGALLFDKNAQGGPLQIGDRVFTHGVSTHARSDLVYLIAGGYSKFRSWVGVDGSNPNSKEATARFLVFADGTKLFDSGLLRMTSPASLVDLDVTGVNVLRLVVTYAGVYAKNVDWAEAELVADPTPPTIRPAVQQSALQQIRSGHLTFTAGGGSLAGLTLENGKLIPLSGTFGMGPFTLPGARPSITQAATIMTIPHGISWRWECRSQSHKPWTAPVDTVFHCPAASQTKVWLPCGYGSKWEDPLVAKAFQNKTYDYGAFFNRENGLSLPMATIIDEENKIGVSFIQSPRDVLLDMQVSTTNKGEIRFSRAFHRFGGKSSNLQFHMDIVVHEPDVRAALNVIVERYREYFDPPNQFVQQVGGGGAYSGWEGPLDVKKFSAMAFSMNWKASIDFPYMGVFLPPVKLDEKWNRFAGGGEGDFGPQDEGRYGQTSIRQMSAYSTDMRSMGFHVLNYFNVTEFGANITYPPPAPKAQDDPNLWKSANDLLHDKLESAVLKTPDPIWTWGDGVIMDCGDSAYRNFLLDQARRHVQELPDSSGICIDRMDWLTRYNPGADDGVSWIDGSSRHLRRSWISLMEELGPIFHNAGKVIFGNDMDRRLELMRQLDGIYDEHGYFPYNLNTSALLALRKPLVCWTSDEDPFRSNPDEYFQRHLYLGAFPTIPFPGNDHSILPSQEYDRLYLDYGPLFNALKGRVWLLRPGVIQVDGTAKANVFETPAGYVIFVGLAGSQNNARVTLRRLPSYVRVLYPGGGASISLGGERNTDVSVFNVPLQRGCAMLLMDKEVT